MRWLLDACYLLAAIVAAPIIAYKSLRTGKYRRDWDQRRGLAPTLPPGRSRVWFHAVSMGEVNAVRGLVEAWQSRCPETEVVISCTTDTGIDRARELFPALTIFRYPLDLSRFVRRGLDRVCPTLVVLVELEVWPQFLRETARRGIPVAVVNGRLTAGKSLRWFRLVGPLIRPVFRRLAWVGAQDEVYAERFRIVGVLPERVHVTGSMKWDTAVVTDTLPGTDELARAMGLDRGRALWVCGSTAPGEEQVILDAWSRLRSEHPELQLVIVPRKPERFDEVADLIERAGYACIRRSRHPNGAGPTPSGTAVHLGDTMGELRKFYALADVVFTGRTLADMGGSDVMEVAALARPIVVGPHVDNFVEAVARLERAGGIRRVREDLAAARVVDALSEAVGALLRHPDEARAMGRAAREVVQRNVGATERTLAALMEIHGKTGSEPVGSSR